MIIFRIEISNELGGFASASNFINKVCNNELLTSEEVNGITSMYWKMTGNVTPVLLVKNIVEYQNVFKTIRKPEYLNEICKKHQVIFCLWIREEKLSDVVELQYDILMKQFFKGEKILTVLEGTKSFYFKVSHYLYYISCHYDSLYNSIYYVENNSSLIRLQKKHVEHFNDFMPLQLFSNKENTLFDALNMHIPDEELKCLFSGAGIQRQYPSVIQGGLNLLKKFQSRLIKIDSDQVVGLLNSGNVFSFLLFAYSFGNVFKTELPELAELKRYYVRMQDYAAGCEQLVENTIHHSLTGCGGISIRFHEFDSSYVKMRYSVKVERVPNVEVLITDYAANNVSGNIADNFRKHMEEEGLKGKFLMLQPINLLGIKMDEDYEEYYRKSDHIGKHIGLKIFRNIVEENKGIFSFYSHRNHKAAPGEEYCYQGYTTENQNVQGLPGTGYTVLFPLIRSIAEMTRAEVGIDYNIRLMENVDFFVKGYSCESNVLDRNYFTFANQEEKEAMIYELSQRWKEERFKEDGRRRIIYVSVRNIMDEAAEYIGKALLMAGISGYIPDFVFYDCSKEFEHIFQNTMKIYYEMRELQYLFKDREFVIALYTVEPMESCFIIPGHLDKTFWINRRNSYAGSEYDGTAKLPLNMVATNNEQTKIWEDVPPYDILYRTGSGKKQATIFERYTLQILNTNIQERAFGCKISDTHMRLGSTIHIDNFYEAELLFQNRLFTSRFAYLLVKQICTEEKFLEADRITLYSYALYSEPLIVELMNVLEKLYPEKDMDYAILEREAEHRDFTHVDRIRYSRTFVSKQEQTEYFKNRSIVCIVPINSTLKTHEKLISYFCEDNEGVSRDNIIMNYALILIGSEGENKYWTIDEDNRTFSSIALNITPTPRYNILIKVKYYEALGCELCFPKQPLDEVPLIEVNAASTIPNQSFGIYNRKVVENRFSFSEIEREEESLSVLKDSLIYSHTKRGENHYLYYFKTDDLFLKNKRSIMLWLEQIAGQIQVRHDEYHILFCPSHFSNAGFLECVNRIVFQSAALIIRVDVDKEYRSNMLAKYSNLTALVNLICQNQSEKRTLKVYYIDDSIITGRTFFRAKSLISSVVDRYRDQEVPVEIHVFEKIFVLLDRNSRQSRLQYIGCWDSKNKREQQLDDNYFAYRTLHISSMRNHGDSCTLCQLEREAELLYRSSSTDQMADYWKKEQGKFGVNLLRDKQEEQQAGGLDTKTTDKDFRRMFCSHIVAMALSENRHGNQREYAVQYLLQLLLDDYHGRKGKLGQQEAFEYFLSYLKVTSRPFLVFDKTIKESVFDVQLVLVESLLTTWKVKTLLSHTQKGYLKKSTSLFKKVIEDVIRVDFSSEQRKDLFLLLMKQLTEMKSNYFIRTVNIPGIAKFAKQYGEDEIYTQYLRQTKKLLGVSSDTSKSAWFNHEICQAGTSMKLPDMVLGNLILENTRAYFDGIDKLSKVIQLDDKMETFLCRDRWYGPEAKYLEKGKAVQLDEQQMMSFLKKTLRKEKHTAQAREKENLKNTDPKKYFQEHYNKTRSSYERQCNEVDNEKEVKNNITKVINKELQKTQFRDFNSILSDMGFRNDKGEIDADGVVSLLAGAELLRLCNAQKDGGSKQERIEDICYEIVCLIEKVVRARDVKILLECPLECDRWKDQLRTKYNQMIDCVTKDPKEKQKISLPLQKRKEYLEIADSGVKYDIIEATEFIVASRIDRYRCDPNAQEMGFYVDGEEGYLVWEIGKSGKELMQERNLLLYVDFYDLQLPQDWFLLRNLFCMKHVLNTTIFKEEYIDYLFELMLADKERLMYNLDKAHSHTAAEVKSTQCTLVRVPEGEQGCFRTFVFTLLSDLQVSQVYRQSLKDSYYGKNLSIYRDTCGKVLEVFYQGDFLNVVESKGMDGISYLKICVEFPEQDILMDESRKLAREDEIFRYSEANGGNEIFLLILALVMNVAGKERGLQEKDAEDSEKMGFVVYLSKTENGCLRIANKCGGKEANVDKINEELCFPPQKDKGISLWSISRYVASVYSVLLAKEMKQTAVKLESMVDESDRRLELRRLKKILNQVLGEEFSVKAGSGMDKNGIKYFYMDIPILVEKYETLLAIEKGGE